MIRTANDIATTTTTVAGPSTSSTKTSGGLRPSPSPSSRDRRRVVASSRHDLTMPLCRGRGSSSRPSSSFSSSSARALLVLASCLVSSPIIPPVACSVVGSSIHNNNYNYARLRFHHGDIDRDRSRSGRRRRRRRNNTGFYYGIRDDDVVMLSLSHSPSSDSSSSSLPLRRPSSSSSSASSSLLASSSSTARFQPSSVSSSLARFQPTTTHGHEPSPSIRDERARNGAATIPSQTAIRSGTTDSADARDNGPGLGRLATALRDQLSASCSLYMSQSLLERMQLQRPHPPTTLRSGSRRLARSLSRSLMQHHPSLMMLRSTLEEADDDARWQPPAWNAKPRDGALSLPLALQGGGLAVSRREEEETTSPSSQSPVSDVSTMTKQRPPANKTRQSRSGRRRRRKNNTGFYYGIREDVLEKKDERDDRVGRRRRRSRTPGSKGLPPKGNEKSSPTPPKPRADGPFAGKERNGKKASSAIKEKKSSATKLPVQLPKPPKLPKLSKKKKNEPPASSDASNAPPALDETMSELRGMREEIVALREELRAMDERLRREGGDGNPAAAATNEGKKRGGRGGRQPPPPRGRRKDAKEEERPSRPSEDDGFAVDDDLLPKEEGEPLLPPMPKRRPAASSSSEQKRERFERIGEDVERWARDELFEERDDHTTLVADNGVGRDGWRAIDCNKFIRKKFNGDGRTEVYLKWMTDPRDPSDVDSISAASNPDRKYPCLKCHSTVDAPLPRVCAFLADPDAVPLYNDLVVEHADVEELSPSGKITWTRCPKILVVKPRDFVTYCGHRWLGDGTQVLVNQACEHEDRPGTMLEGQGDFCRGFALRGANFISEDPDDPNKTRITMLSHANPGGGLPQWAMNTAVNAVVAVEPFKFFHRINEGAREYRPRKEEDGRSTRQRTSSEAVMASNGDVSPRRSQRPAGIAHLGFTCLWPNGGGLKAEGEWGNADPLFASESRDSTPLLPREDNDSLGATYDDGDEGGGAGALMEDFDD